MAFVVLIGTQHELLSGVVTSLEDAGFVVRSTDSIAEARELISASLPIAVVMDRGLAIADGSVPVLPLLPGGALFLYHTADDAVAPVPPVLARSAMAELTLPLERNRLIALLQRVRERHRTRRGEAPGSERSAPH